MSATIPVIPSEHLLRRPMWDLRHANGEVIAERLLFVSGGLVWSETSVLWRWRLQTDTLVISALDGSGWLTFPWDEGAAKGPTPVMGWYTATGNAVMLSLMPQAPPSPGPPGNMHAAVTVGGNSSTLLVTLNSLNRPFNGRETRWEFYDLPHRIGVDHIRLAERTDPAHWYLDKTRPIAGLISGVLSGGYRQVVLCGISSGGYGSLLLAEMLSCDHPEIVFRTSTINPQTCHAEQHRRFLRTLPHAMPPALISDEAYARRDCDETDIDVMAGRRGARQNLSHTIFYDAGNPADAYYVGRLAGLPGFALRPFDFGVGHMSGCIALFERRVVQMDVAEACRSVEGD